MRQKVFLNNANLCLGCRACQIACAVNHGLPPGVFLRKVKLIEFLYGLQIIKYYLSESCNHCTNPECLRLCPQRAFRKRRDGIVVFDQSKCNGCGTCTRGCPFEAPVVNPFDGKVIKCDLCYGRIEEGTNPFCVSACSVSALKIIDSAVENYAPDLVKTLPGLPRIQITRPSNFYVSVSMGKQVLRTNRKLVGET